MSGLCVQMPEPIMAEFLVTCLKMNNSGEKYYDEYHSVKSQSTFHGELSPGTPRL